MIRIAVCGDERCFAEWIQATVLDRAGEITVPIETSLCASSGLFYMLL